MCETGDTKPETPKPETRNRGQTGRSPVFEGYAEPSMQAGANRCGALRTSPFTLGQQSRRRLFQGGYERGRTQRPTRVRVLSHCANVNRRFSVRPNRVAHAFVVPALRRIAVKSLEILYKTSLDILYS
jgi:hypothetical protein